MSHILCRRSGKTGHVTLNRPEALNALTWDMTRTLHASLAQWRDDPCIDMILIDAAGERAFCAGGDVAQLYTAGKAGDFRYGADFFQDEYRLNAAVYEYPKPIVAFMQGFVMGGGVGIGCHARHRIVGESTKMAMPECSIGLVPDVGGSLLLARAPGRVGEYLGLTGDRMDNADALFTGFADHFIPERDWPDLKAALLRDADPAILANAAHPAPPSRLAKWQSDIDRLFGASMGDIITALEHDSTDAARHAVGLMQRNSPLSMTVALAIIRAVRAQPEIRHALDLEYRFTHRAARHGDLLEGVRAAIIDKDRKPNWTHRDWRDIPAADIARMTAPPQAGPLELDKVTA